MKYNVDLAFTDFFRKDWESKRKERGNPDERPDPTSKKNDPWDWKKKVSLVRPVLRATSSRLTSIQYKALESQYGAPRTLLSRKYYLGGKDYNITKWTKREREEAAYDGEDPIPADIMQAIKRGDNVGMV